MRQLEELAGFDDTMSQLNAKLGVAALDMDAMKAAAFRANHGDVRLRQGDVWALTPADLPKRGTHFDLAIAIAVAGAITGVRSSANKASRSCQSRTCLAKAGSAAPPTGRASAP